MKTKEERKVRTERERRRGRCEVQSSEVPSESNIGDDGITV